MKTIAQAEGSRTLVALLLGLGVLVGCARDRGGMPDPMTLTEKITHAVYADDLDAATESFDDAAKKEATRASVGAISDAMHQLGALKSITPRWANADAGRYDYDLTFERGTLIAHLRLDPSGKVGAYHIDSPAKKTGG